MLDLGVSEVVKEAVRAALESFEEAGETHVVFVAVVREDCRAMEVVDLHNFARMLIDHERSRCHQGSVGRWVLGCCWHAVEAGGILEDALSCLENWGRR